MLQWVGIQALYTIEDSLYNLEGFTDAEWIEVGRPTVLVGKFESVASKIKRKEQGLRKPRMPLRKTIEVFGKDYRIASISYTHTQFTVYKYTSQGRVINGTTLYPHGTCRVFTTHLCQVTHP